MTTHLEVAQALGTAGGFLGCIAVTFVVRMASVKFNLVSSG